MNFIREALISLPFYYVRLSRIACSIIGHPDLLSEVRFPYQGGRLICTSFKCMTGTMRAEVICRNMAPLVSTVSVELMTGIFAHLITLSSKEQFNEET